MEKFIWFAEIRASRRVIMGLENREAAREDEFDWGFCEPKF